MERGRILVMLSSYNGEKYLNEQLDSILAQEGVDLHLLIRDDGSTDGTRSIIRDYIKRYPSMVELIEGENVGWKQSFHLLIQEAGKRYREYDYFAFADQDDIWLPEKLSKAVKSLESVRDKGALYCCNQYYYKDGKTGHLINGTIPCVTEKGCLVRNYATGCTIVFNRRLLDYLSEGIPNYSIAHDYWCYMVAVLCGEVIIDPHAYILYRQHESNQIGSKTGWKATWSRRLKSVKALVGNHYRERVTKELLRLVGPHMTAEGKEAAEKLAFYRRSPGRRIALLTDSGYTLNNKSNDFWLRLRIILGRL